MFGAAEPGSVRERSVLVLTLALGACNLPFRPATPPAASAGGTEVTIEAMPIGSLGAPSRALGGSLELVVRVRPERTIKITRTMLTRLTRAPCTGGAPGLGATIDGPTAAELPLEMDGDHTLVLGFYPSPEEALEEPTALDIAFEAGGRRACLRTPLGSASAWQRTPVTGELAIRGGAPLGKLGDIGTTWSLDERLGILAGHFAWTAGLQAGVAACGECNQNAAIVLGPAVAATFYPVTAGRAALGIEVSYTALFEMMHYPQDQSGSTPHLREWYQVPGVALQWEWLVPPRGSKVRLRDRDFNAIGFEAFEQLWIPTLHPDRPGVMIGLGLVGRVAF
jgi:hypothetical protein